MRVDVRRDWAVGASVAAHALAIGLILARFQPAPRLVPPPRLEIRLPPPVTETVAATAPSTPVVAAEAPPVVAARPPEPVVPAAPEPEVVKSKSVAAPKVAARPPKRHLPAAPKPPKKVTPVEEQTEPPRIVTRTTAQAPTRRADPGPVARAPAAPAPAAAPTSSAPPPDYLAKISARLAQFKEYPRSARLRRIEGDVLLWFSIDRSGRVVKYKIVRSSGHDVLDEAVDDMIHNASPFPPMPASMPQTELEITQPITFHLR